MKQRLISGLFAALLLLTARAAAAAIPLSEREALVALFNATGGSAWLQKAGWLGSAGTECDWYGVQCNSDKTAVISIILDANALKGTVPAQIASFPSLRELDLSRNSVTGPIPSEIGQLANLERLALNDNGLTGPIPSSVGRLSRLNALDLRSNALTSIPAEIGSAASLVELRLYHNQFSGSIPSQVGNLVQLTDLDLAGNAFTGSLPDSFASLANLQNFTVEDNQLSGTLPSWLANLPALADLRLSYNKFSGAIPPEFGRLRNLQMLDLSSNDLTGSLPKELGDLASLERLWLNENRFSGSLPKELGRLTNLRDLVIEKGGLSGEIPPELAQLTKLENLWLRGNGLSGSIPSEIAQMTQLKALGLHGNKLSGNLPAAVFQLPSLELLYLDNNQLTGTLPASIAAANLETIYLSDNQLTGSIPPALGALAKLGSLYLNGNSLTGEIPPELSKLSNLGELHLGENKLTGTIPAILGNLTNLIALRLNNNQLTGAIPREIYSLTKLRYLALSANQLTGTIPSELGNLTQLEYLFLSENELTGSLPSSVGNLTSLLQLHLDANALSGAIPGELGRIGTLEDLELSGNAFSGTLPADFGGLVNLTQLTLRGNQLSGPLPAQFGNLGKLESIDLAENRFTGALPSELGRLANLRYLQLEQNEFSGALPREIGGLTSLESMDLSNNRFGGTLPSEFGNLRSLRGANLSENQFSGAVPSTIASLTGMPDGGLDLSYNALYTKDSSLNAFLDRKQGQPWMDTQTVSPAGVAVAELTDRSAVVSWTAIAYTDHGGGYEVTATPRGSGTAVIATTGSKENDSLLVRRLQPSTPYDFTVRTITFPHDGQQNLLASESTTAVSGTTTAKITAPADIQLTTPPGGLVQVGGVAQNEDAFVLTNFGDVAEPIALSKDGAFFEIAPAAFTLAGGASQTVTVKSVAGQPTGTYDGRVTVPAGATYSDINIDIRLLSVQQPAGRAVAEAETTRVEIAGDSGGTSVGSAKFLNRGTAAVVGMLLSDVPWLSTSHDLVTIDPGSSYSTNFTVDRTKRPDAGAANGTVSGSLQLVYVDGSSATASLLQYKPTDTTPTPGLSVSIVTVVDTVKPAVSAGGIPAATPGEVVRFLAGVSTYSRTAEQFISDLSIANVYGASPVSDLRMYFTSAGAASSTLATLGAIAPSRAVTVANFAKGVYGTTTSQVGTLQIRSRDWDRLLLNARMTNHAVGGRITATTVPIFRSDRALPSGGSINLAGLRKSGSEHTNLYVQETGGVAGSAQVEFLDATGAAIGTARPADSLPAYGLLELADGVPAGAVTAIVTNRSSSRATMVAYAVVVDEKSGDTWTIVDWNAYYDFSSGSAARVPFLQATSSSTAPGRRRAVAHAVSGQAATELTLFNAGTSAASVRLRYRDTGDRTAEETISLGARETRKVRAGLSSSDPSYLSIEPLRGSVTASSRTYQSAAQGTLGTTVPVLAASSGLRLGQKQTFSSVDDSAGASATPAAGTQRTAIGLLEMSGSSVTVRASLLLADGKSPFSVTISRDFELRASQLLFVDSIAIALAAPFAQASWGDLHDLQLEFEVVAGTGAVTPFLLVTNSDSADTMLRLE